MCQNSQIASYFFSQGAVIYILDVFCNSEVPANREKSAEVLSKMVTDKLVGPKVRICVTRFLPSIFLDAMKQSPEAAVRYKTGILSVNQILIHDIIGQHVGQ